MTKRRRSQPLTVDARTRPKAGAPQAVHVDVDRLNYVNIGLMLLSAALACTLPFEIFLISYAVLGPLHYLTQISWLYDRGFYAKGQLDWIALALLSAAAFLSYGGWVPWDGSPIAALGLGVLAAFVSSIAVKLLALAVLAVIAPQILSWTPAAVFFVVLLATVVHVYVFTGLFILAGSIRAQSRSGYLSLAVFLACGTGLLVVQPAAAAYHPSKYVVDSLAAFNGVIDAMARLIPGDGGRHALVAIGRFLAFAYTYHYLNWFSKTEIIRWHEMSRGRLTTVAVVYVTAVALYGYDYSMGLMALYFLSIAHVFLEFPLDARTLVEVVTGSSLRPRAA